MKNFLLLAAALLCWGEAHGQFLKRPALGQPDLREIFTNRIIYQRLDREQSTYTYDTAPLVFDNGRGHIILQPFITLNAVTGDTQFHLWVSYRPPFGAAGTAPFIYPKYFTLLSARQKLTLPLWYYHQALPSTNLVSIPGAPSASSESAYTVLSPEDLSTLISIAYEGSSEEAIEAWEPTAFGTRLALQSRRGTAAGEAAAQKKSVQDYVKFQESQGEKADYRALNWGAFVPPLPSMADQRAVSLVLSGGKASASVDAVQTDLTPILEMVDLYQALSNRTIAMP